jgi:hypothetical protein
MIKPLFRTGAAVILATLLLSDVSLASFPTLRQRLPAASNVIVAVNFAKVADSPYGKQAQWSQRLADNWARQPMMIPPGAQRLIMAASVKPSTFESYWEMSLIEMDQLPSLQTLAKDEGGHIDRVWDKDAVASPINAYFVPLENNVLASITPAERSEIARWVRQPIKPEGNVTSEYINAVVGALDDTTDIVMAMDHEGAYGVPNIRKWLELNQIQGVNEQNIAEVTAVLGTMKGIKLDIRVTDKITAVASVPFDRDAYPLKGCAKPIMLGLLSTAGMRIDEVPKWTFESSGKQVSMRGELSEVSLRKLLSVVQSPIPAAALATPARNGAATTDPAQVSLKYYKTVCTILDSAHAGKSAADTATWTRSAARRIDQLPILNVDPALVEWGALVSAKLKQACGVMGVGQTQINARVSGVMDPEYEGYYYDSNGYYVSNYDKAAHDNANQQRRQAALEQRAQAQEQALQIVNEIAPSRAKIRADMVAKYNIEF